MVIGGRSTHRERTCTDIYFRINKALSGNFPIISMETLYHEAQERFQANSKCFIIKKDEENLPKTSSLTKRSCGLKLPQMNGVSVLKHKMAPMAKIYSIMAYDSEYIIIKPL